MEKNMETTIVYWGYSLLGLYRDNEKENGNYCSILGLKWDNGTFHLQNLPVASNSD